MTLRFGEVVLIQMRFQQTAGAKVRPAVVLLDTGDDDFVAAPITSQLRNSDYDLVMENWREAGLNAASYVRIHKLTVLAKADVARSLGHMRDQDSQRLTSLVCRAFCREAGTK